MEVSGNMSPSVVKIKQHGSDQLREINEITLRECTLNGLEAWMASLKRSNDSKKAKSEENSASDNQKAVVVQEVSQDSEVVDIIGIIATCNSLGPYIASRYKLAIKIMRLLAHSYDDGMPGLELDEVRDSIVDVCDQSLVPGCSLADPNSEYSRELWKLMKKFPYTIRYRIYWRWQNEYADMYPVIHEKRLDVVTKSKRAMKCLCKDTTEETGRRLAKLCVSYPLAVTEMMLEKIQDFRNFIEPMVDSLKHFSDMALDVLSFSLIEQLSSPQKQPGKLSENACLSPWLCSLATFSALAFKKYSIDFSGILQYIVNHLKDKKCLDLIVLREVVSSISGIEAGTDLTQTQIDALCGGDYLRTQAGGFSNVHISKKAAVRFRDALLKDKQFESLCVALGQLKHLISFHMENYPIKLATSLLDLGQETFLQFHYFLSTNLKSEDYAKLPAMPDLINRFRVPVEAAMHLTRQLYFKRISQAYERSKKEWKENTEDGQQRELDKNALYAAAFEKILSELEDDFEALPHNTLPQDSVCGKILCRRKCLAAKCLRQSAMRQSVYPADYWTGITRRLYALFWLLSANDLYCPKIFVDEIEKSKKQEREIISADSENAAKETTNHENGKPSKQRLTSRLTEEMNKQQDRIKRVKKVLSDQMSMLFLPVEDPSNTSSSIMFMKCCVLPRAIFSEVDAIYCAKFVEALHFQRTQFFPTIVFLDRIFSKVELLLDGLTEHASICLGRFCCLCLDLVLGWNRSEKKFAAECEGYPGSNPKIAVKESTQKNEFSYDFFRKLCYKWQVTLADSLKLMLVSSSSTYLSVRNALSFAKKIIPNFPLVDAPYMVVEKAVEQVRDAEKKKRPDLNLLATSYHVLLSSKRSELQTFDEFYNSDRRASKRKHSKERAVSSKKQSLIPEKDVEVK